MKPFARMKFHYGRTGVTRGITLARQASVGAQRTRDDATEDYTKGLMTCGLNGEKASPANVRRSSDFPRVSLYRAFSFTAKHTG